MKLVLIDLVQPAGATLGAALAHAGAARAAGATVVCADDVVDRFEPSTALLPLRACDEYAASWMKDFLRAAAATEAGRALANYRGFDLWYAAETSFRQDLYRAIGFARRANVALEGVSDLTVISGRTGHGLLAESFLHVAAARAIHAEVRVVGTSADLVRSLLARLARLARTVRKSGKRLDIDVPAVAERSTQDACHIVFADFFGPNVHSLSPVRRALMERDAVTTTWLGLRQQVSARALAEGGAIHDVETDLAGSPDVAAASDAEINRRIDQLFDDSPFVASLAVDGLPVGGPLRNRLRHVLLHTLRNAARLALGISRALDRLSPTVVVTANDTWLAGRLLAQACRLRDIPLVYVQHGVIPSDPYASPGAADVLLVWGDVSRGALEKLGNRPDQLWVTGSAQYDRIFHERSATGLQSSPPTVTFMSQPPVRGIPASVYRRTIAAVLEAARQLDDVRFVIKLHPVETDRMFRDAAKGHDASTVEVLRDADTQALTRSSDVIVTQYSTTGLEALLFGKPLVLVNLTGEPARVPYAEAGAALLVTEPSDLAMTIRKALDDEPTRRALAERRQAFEAEMFAARDGSASRRCADAILTIADGARSAGLLASAVMP